MPKLSAVCISDRIIEIHGEQVRETVTEGSEYTVTSRTTVDLDSLGVIHCPGGLPAVMMSDGTLEFWVHGDLHREDGPAIDCPDRGQSWYWHGIEITEEVREQGIDQLSPDEIRFWLPILAAQKSK